MSSAPTLFDLAPAPAAVPEGTVTRAPVPNLADYDVISANLSGGGDSFAMMYALMEAARDAGVEDRVWTFHATLGPAEWPAVAVGGRTFGSAADLAAAQSRFCGVPAERHLERTKLTLDAEPVPYDLLTYIAAYGRFMRLGTRFCTKGFKEQIEEAAFTPILGQLKLSLGLAARPSAVKLTRPLRRLKVLGLLAEESADRAKRPPYRHVAANGVRHVDEWLPIHGWTKQQVRDLHAAVGMPYHWTYDSRPGAGDWAGTSRCSCSLCFLASKRDLLLAVQRRPRLAALYAEVEHARGDTFRADWSMHDLITWSRRPDAPDPGIVITDETEEFEQLERSVRAALSRPPRKEPNLARGRTHLPLLAGTCAACP